MSKAIIRIILIAGLALLAAGGPAAQEDPADAPRATGLIPLDARQLAEIVRHLGPGQPRRPQPARLRTRQPGPGRKGKAGPRPLDRPSRRGGDRRRPGRPRRLRSGGRGQPGNGRRPARVRRQQPAPVLPSDPQPGQPRLVRQLRLHLLPSLVHDGFPEEPGHPGPRGQHQQVLAEVDLQYGQRGRERGLELLRQLFDPRKARRGVLGRFPLRFELHRLVPERGRLAERPRRPDEDHRLCLQRLERSRARADQGAPDGRLYRGLRDLHQLLVLADHPGRSPDHRRQRGRGPVHLLLDERGERRPRHDHCRLQRRHLDGHERQQPGGPGGEGGLPDRQFLGHRLVRKRLHLAGLRRPARTFGRARGPVRRPGPGLPERHGLRAEGPQQLCALRRRRVHGQPRQEEPDEGHPRALEHDGDRAVDDLDAVHAPESGRRPGFRRLDDGGQRDLRPRLHRHPGRRGGAPALLYRDPGQRVRGPGDAQRLQDRGPDDRTRHRDGFVPRPAERRQPADLRLRRLQLPGGGL